MDGWMDGMNGRMDLWSVELDGNRVNGGMVERLEWQGRLLDN